MPVGPDAEAVRAIELRDPDGRAVIALDRDAPSRPRVDGRLQGLVLTVKDVFRTVHLPTTFGTMVVDPWELGPEASAVTVLRRAGAIVIGKTNCGELCIGDYVVAGVPRNPAAPGHSVSGSSGGCAAAVGAGLVDASICSDTGGSARIPAAFCGVLGLKVTTGAVPLDGVLPLAPTLDALGIVARSVGAMGRVASELLGRSLSCDRAPRVGVVDPRAAADPGLVHALEVIGGRIATKVVAPPSLDGWRDLHRSVIGTEARALHGHLVHDRRLGRETRDFLRAEPPPRPARGVRDRLLAAVDDAFVGIDVLVTPAVDGAPPRHPPARDSAGFWGQLDWLAPLNHSGHPALVVPVGGPRGPIAVQLVARHGDEALLLAVASMLDDPEIRGALWSGR